MEQQIDIVVSSLRGFVFELGAFLPKLLGAVVILIAGWLISKLLLFVVVRGLKGIKFNAVTENAGLDEFLKRGGVRKSAIDVLGLMVYWLAILMTLLTATNSLGLTVLSELLARVTQFAPNVIVAVLILTIGLYFARFVADAVTAYSRNVGLADADLVGNLTRYAITAFVVIVALSQVNIAGRILEILFAGVVFAVALAFGLGGQKWAADKLDKLDKGKPGMKKAA
jgi:hypothetical protein